MAGADGAKAGAVGGANAGDGVNAGDAAGGAGGANAGGGAPNGGKCTGAGDAVCEKCATGDAAGDGAANGAANGDGPGAAIVEALARSGAIIVGDRESVFSGNGADTPCCRMWSIS